MAGLPNAELRFLEGTSASLFFEHTDEVVADLVAFVTGVRPQAVAGASSGAA